MSAHKTLKLPSHFDLEPELLEQLSGRSGHQRCVDGDGELLLMVHDVPKPRVPERSALFFWKRRDDVWVQSSGTGLSELNDMLDRYEAAVDEHEASIDKVETAADIFKILKHSGPLSRSMRNCVGALEQVLAIDADDREILSLRDRAKEIERAAELLNSDGMVALEFWRAERSEEHARSGARLNRIAYRLNLLAGFFLPLVALGGLFGMNVDLPEFIRPLFWVILISGLVVGGVLLYLVGRQTSKHSDFEDEHGDDE